MRNFHSLIDSETINISEITALVGANQAGKSSILLGLASISMDSTFEDFDLTQLEGVSKRYLDNELGSEEIPIVEAAFDLSAEEEDELNKIGFTTEKLSVVKYYDNSYSLGINDNQVRIPSKSKLQATYRELTEAILEFRGVAKEHLSVAPNSQFADKFERSLDPFNLKFASFIDLTVDSAIGLLSKLEEFARLDLDQSFKETISKFVDDTKDLIRINLFKTESELALYRFLLYNLPRTVYYKSFDKLADEVAITELRTNPSKNRTFMNLLRLSGLKIDSLVRIKNEKQRQAYVEQASGQATKLLRKAWNQEALEIQFRHQGDKLMVFMKDSSAVETLLPPSSGSEGFQWFLGFFINFGALTNATYTDAILLLDDPGVYLHPSAHRDLLNLFEEYLAKNVITIYTTHQPFLIPTGRLYRLRLVKKVSEGHSIATQKFYEADEKNVLLPLKSALSLTMEDGLLSGKYSIVCQGPSEKILIEGMIKEFIRRGIMESSSLEDLSVIGASSADISKMYAVLLEINGLSYVIIFDNDALGRDARSDLIKSEINETGLILLPKSARTDLDGFKVEDLFSAEVYAEALDQVYGSALNFRFEQLLEKLRSGKDPINNKARDLLKSRRMELDKVAVAREIIRVTAMQPELDDSSLQNFAALFDEIGKAIGLWVINYAQPEDAGKTSKEAEPSPTNEETLGAPQNQGPNNVLQVQVKKEAEE